MATFERLSVEEYRRELGLVPCGPPRAGSKKRGKAGAAGKTGKSFGTLVLASGGQWWKLLSEVEQVSIDASVRLLEERGPNLGHPHSLGIQGSRHSHMRELRIQHSGRPYRVLYAFDPRRLAILLIGGDKTGKDRWYEEHLPLADKRYDTHLDELKKEGLNDGKEILWASREDDARGAGSVRGDCRGDADRDAIAGTTQEPQLYAGRGSESTQR